MNKGERKGDRGGDLKKQNTEAQNMLTETTVKEK